MPSRDGTAGNSRECGNFGVACLPADQRGRRRVAKSCDIGAIEGIHP